MEKNLNPLISSPEEINLVDVIKKLIASKKLIIYVTLFFTLLGAAYNTQTVDNFKSILLLQVGNISIDGKVDKVESANVFNRGIQVSLDYTKELDVNPNIKLQIKTPAASEIIQISTASNSIELNASTINQVAEFIINRHKNIRQKTITQLASLINSLNLEIEYMVEADINKFNSLNSILKNKISYLRESIRLDKVNSIEERASKVKELNSSFVITNKKINQLSKIIDSNLSNDGKTELEQVIHGYQMKLLNYQEYREQLENQLESLVREGNEDTLLNEIMHGYQMKLLSYQDEKVQFETKIMSLKKYLQENKSLNSVILDDPMIFFALNKEKSELSMELQFLKEQPNTRAIGQIETSKIEKNYSFIFLGFIAGLFLSIFIALFIEPFRAIKWNAS